MSEGFVQSTCLKNFPSPFHLRGGNIGEKTVRLYRCSDQFSLLF
uniref:Uncharacterized protein n=1 Tax=Podoviridae sp. cttxo15 TaxID=2826584 RepID=A0A8S5N1G7_9CAUD|nr:MAG TPA: hypothetical protein [Podoviridae sp. cttxo15]